MQFSVTHSNPERLEDILDPAIWKSIIPYFNVNAPTKFHGNLYRDQNKNSALPF